MSDLAQIVEKLRNALMEIKSKLAEGDLQVAAIEEFKMTLDDVRTSLLALIAATGTSDYNGSLRKLRLRRAAQACHGVLSSIVDGAVTGSTPGLPDLEATVRETRERLERLIGH